MGNKYLIGYKVKRGNDLLDAAEVFDTEEPIRTGHDLEKVKVHIKQYLDCETILITSVMEFMGGKHE